MANYICSARSNNFKVGRPQEFLDWIATMSDVDFVEQDEDPAAKSMVGCLLCYGEGGWPCYVWDEETDTDRDIDFFAELAPFLAPGSIAVLMEVGSEKLRYLVGYAIAIRSTGETIELSLTDIFQKIEDEWGPIDTSTIDHDGF